MPARTYQIAIKESGSWLRSYVCAENETQAMLYFCDEHPELPLEWILGCDEFEVSACE